MNILIVDDEILVRMGLKAIFACYKDQFRIIEASNGKQAFELYASHKPPLVLVDIAMPVMDGMDFIAAAKKLDYKTKFLILTCHDEFDLARKAIKLGVSDYIIKTSINEKELLAIAWDIRKETLKEEEGKIIGKDLPDEFAKVNLLRNIMLGKVTNKEMLLAVLDKYDMQFMLKPLALLYFLYENPQATKIVEQMLQEYLGGMMMEVDEERALVLLVLPQNISDFGQKSFIEEFCDRLVRSFEMYFNTDLSIGVCICENPEDLFQCSKRAERALISRFYYERPGFTFFTKSPVAHIEAVKLEEHRDGIAQCLQKIEYAEANIKLENFIAHLQLTKPENVCDIRYIFIQLYCIFSQHISQHYSCINDVVMDRFKGCGRFSGREGLFDFFRIFNEILEKLDYLLSKDMTSYHTKIIIKAKQYINGHLDEDTDLDAVARHVNLSPSYFSELFKEKTGEKFIDYITGVKMVKAQELLQKGQKVYSIMEQLGYNNHSYFCRLFKKVTGKNLRELKRIV